LKSLDFFIVDKEYVEFLRNAEIQKRGFSRVPNNDYEKNSRKPKFFCGIVLSVKGKDYYVPISSYKQQRYDNILILNDIGEVKSSLRFNYMFPVPKELVVSRDTENEPDLLYRALLSQELKYCIKNQDAIFHKAERTYRRVLLGKDLKLVMNACDFKLLEAKCAEYCIANGLEKPFSMEN